MPDTPTTAWVNWPDGSNATNAAVKKTATSKTFFWQWWYTYLLGRKVNQLGKGVDLHGKIKIINQGSIRIADNCQLLSEYQTLRLAVGLDAKLEIGEHCYINSAIIAANVQVTIGSNCQFGPFVHLMDSDFHDLTDRQQPGRAAAIHIGDGVRLGAHVIVLQGATIGNGAEILPGSVVTKDIPAGARYGGVPARRIEGLSR